MANSPAFQYYPADMATDPICMFWTMEQIGCYHAMIDYLWLNSGEIQGNSSDFPAKLCGIFRVSHQKRAQKLWGNISKKFQIVDGVISHKRLLKEMQKQSESRLRRSAAGKKGMDSRWKNDNIVMPESITNDNPSSSTSPSTSSSTSVNEGFTLEQVQNEAFKVGLSDIDAEGYFHNRNRQNWETAAGRKITNLNSDLVSWRNNGYKFPDKPKPEAPKADQDIAQWEARDGQFIREAEIAKVKELIPHKLANPKYMAWAVGLRPELEAL